MMPPGHELANEYPFLLITFIVTILEEALREEALRGGLGNILPACVSCGSRQCAWFNICLASSYIG